MSKRVFESRHTRRMVSGVAIVAVCLSPPARGDDAAESPRGGGGPALSASAVSAGLLSPTIASISIENGNIFDLDNPEEDGFLYRLANRLHVKTRPYVIRQQLLFREGDPLSPRALEESERILRDNRYLQDASIERSLRDDGRVDVNVVTADVWTLMPRFNFSRSGGVNTVGFGIKESNLLGRGIAVEASFESDVDRDLTAFSFTDRNIGDSWYAIDAGVGIASDGHANYLRFGQPFYSLDARNANGLVIEDVDQLDYLYDGGEIQSSFRHRYKAMESFLGWSKGLREGWTRRYIAGVGYERHDFSPPDVVSPGGGSTLPADRRFLYPFVGFEFVEDRYEKTRNVTQVERTEDHYLGTLVAGRLGLASESAGSDRDAILVDTWARTGFGSFENRALTLSGRYSTRLEQGVARNQLLQFQAEYFHRQSDHYLFYAGLAGAAGSHLDVDNQQLLGGDTGLRGYPLRYLSGDSRALLTLEQRLYTDWYPFRLFRVGAAVFFDVGRVWDSAYPSERNGSLHRDVGIGLRLGSTRSGLGRVIHVDLAYPLDGDDSISSVQLLVETRTSF